MKGVLDTSVLIAYEQDRELDFERIPDELAISVVSISELAMGVYTATDELVRSARIRTLTQVHASLEALAIDIKVANRHAELVFRMRESGYRIGLHDSWIAATALAHDAAVVTQDTGFELVPNLEVVLV